ncbi:MAG: hypothetical protein O7C75_12325, partial [Verrucomicrobia bacterium]|nr:hypothetical protein [Verrucomicrobiota bacterium]
RAVWSHALVTFVDDRKIQVENLRMTSDSTYWTATNRIATAQIKEVRFINRGKGAMVGMGFGFLVGGIVGFAAGEDCSRDPNAFLDICFSREEVAEALGLTGALVSAPIGALIGHRDIYLIEHEAATGTN